MGLLMLAVVLLWQQLPGSSGRGCPQESPAIPATLAGHGLQLELATTPDSRACGLSRRDRLAWDRGMLFLFTHPQQVTFWMAETRIPLSLAFLDADGRILAIERMLPEPAVDKPELRVQAPLPVARALEVNAGWFAAHGVGVGDRLTIELPSGLTVQ